MLLDISPQLLQIIDVLNLRLPQILSLLLSLQILDIINPQIPQIPSLRLQVPVIVLIGTPLHRKLRIILWIIQNPQRGMSSCRFTSFIIIIVPGEKYGDSSDGLWSMYLTEAEKQDKDVTESWKGDTEGILVFVSPTPSCAYSPAKTHVEDWSILRNRCGLHY